MMRLLGSRVLVALPPKETEQDAATGYTYQARKQTEGGIILATPADVYDVQIATRGIVMQTGDKRTSVERDDVLALLEIEEPATAASLRAAVNRLAPATFEVQPGDLVIFAPSAGDQISQDGIDYVILDESDILAVVDERAA